VSDQADAEAEPSPKSRKQKGGGVIQAPTAAALDFAATTHLTSTASKTILNTPLLSCNCL
jgi:hypothetical protein